jgi:hypothetical protein
LASVCSLDIPAVLGGDAMKRGETFRHQATRVMHGFLVKELRNRSGRVGFGLGLSTSCLVLILSWYLDCQTTV